MGLFLMNCGGTPDTNPMVEEAQNSYQQLENDTLIVKQAPVALEEAGEAVARAQDALKKGKDKSVIDHEAYMAQQRLKIAQQTALLNAAQDEVKQAESERQKVLIEARQAEAEAAEQRANEALSRAEQQRMEAEQARKEAQEARMEAEKLAKRVNELEAQQTERGLVLTLGDVLFDVDEATLKAGGDRAVRELTNFLNEYEERNVLIEGHTDNTGSDSYNEKLSQQRADAVRQALTANGIAGTRVESQGLGEQYPKASNNSSAGRQQNRRVEVIISDNSGQIPDRQ
jgi:outer membrane protein OmpA-like peptidoglycan-associated protein